MIASRYKVVIEEGEIGFLAIHYSKAIEDINLANTKNVLIISSSRPRENLLIRHNFLKIFGDQISTLDIINFLEIRNINLKTYDLILTTYNHKVGIPSSAIKINYFLSNKDISTIKYSLLNTSTQVSQFFNEALFHHFTEKVSKKEIIQKLCELTTPYNPSDHDLFTSVLAREELGFTAFGNSVACPHPNELICEKSSITVGVLTYPVIWNQEESVQVVLLLCGSRKEDRHLTILFDKISALLRDQEGLRFLINHPSANTFRRLLENS
jgi:lichenan operon transcriptional antiterminator